MTTETTTAQLAFINQEYRPKIPIDSLHGINDELFDLLIKCFDTFKNNGVERFGALEVASWIKQFAKINDGACIPEMHSNPRSIGRILSLSVAARNLLGIECGGSHNNRRMWKFK